MECSTTQISWVKCLLIQFSLIIPIATYVVSSSPPTTFVGLLFLPATIYAFLVMANLLGKNLPKFLLGLSSLLVLKDSKIGQLTVSIWGNEVKVNPGDKPKDSFLEEVLNVPDITGIDEKAILATDSERQVSSHVAEARGQLKESARRLDLHSAGSLQLLLEGLHAMYQAASEKNRLMISMLEGAYRAKLKAEIAGFKAERSKLEAEHIKAVSENKGKQAGGVATGVMAGAGVGAFFGGVGAPIGAAAGAVLGFAAGCLSGNEIEEPEILEDSEIVKKAGVKLGLGKHPKKNIRKKSLEHALILAEKDAEIASTAVSTYEFLLRKALHRQADALKLADVVSHTYQDIKVLFTQAKKTWDKSSKSYIAAKNLLEKVENDYSRSTNALLLTATVTGIVEGFREVGEMNTVQFREELKKKGFNLDGQDIDHIIPKSLGGADHPWNYQEVSSSLNRSWQDGALFEKCLRDPIAFAKGIVISYPGFDGAVVGSLSMVKKKKRWGI